MQVLEVFLLHKGLFHPLHIRLRLFGAQPGGGIALPEFLHCLFDLDVSKIARVAFELQKLLVQILDGFAVKSLGVVFAHGRNLGGGLAGGLACLVNGLERLFKSRVGLAGGAVEHINLTGEVLPLTGGGFNF